MAVYSKGLHHFYKRKRIHEKHEPYPHPQKFKRIMDKLIYVVGIVGPIFTLPQLFKIWIGKNATGVSAISWFTFFIAALFWLIYGIAHKEKPIIFVYGIWAVLDFLIFLGTLLYG